MITAHVKQNFANVINSSQICNFPDISAKKNDFFFQGDFAEMRCMESFLLSVCKMSTRFATHLNIEASTEEDGGLQVKNESSCEVFIDSLFKNKHLLIRFDLPPDRNAVRPRIE
jgi:hypothetical protein